MNEGTEALGNMLFPPGLQFVSCCKNLGDYKRFHAELLSISAERSLNLHVLTDVVSYNSSSACPDNLLVNSNC